LPWIVGFLVFNAYPITSSIAYSFSRYNIVEPAKWVGLRNYIELFGDEYFYKCAFNNLYYVSIGWPACNIISLVAAVLLSRKTTGVGIFRTIFFLPVMMPVVASSLLWRYMYNPEFGVINAILGFVGIEGPIWLADEVWAKPALIFMSTWHTGRGIIIYLAAIQNVPSSYYEAAQIDGAGAVQMFRKITLPLISPIIFFQLVIGIIGSFQYFTEPMIMTNGGPNRSTMPIGMYLYRNAFEFLRMGYASSIAWILFIAIMTFTMILFATQRRWVTYE
jgi:multiple sugar transport system permease protein